MTEKTEATSWVYVLVQNPGGEEQIVGQTDPQNRISFIPTFRQREDAMQSVMHLAREKGKKFEIQAILYEDLERYASRGGFLIFILDESGAITEKRAPSIPPA